MELEGWRMPAEDFRSSAGDFFAVGLRGMKRWFLDAILPVKRQRKTHEKFAVFMLASILPRFLYNISIKVIVGGDFDDR